MKIQLRNKWWKVGLEGMGSNEISLGSMEDGIYFRQEEKGVFLL
jgi:hypothetical protein